MLRRATDPDDADGAFMDGYVMGRLTERAESGDSPDMSAVRDGHDEYVDACYQWSGGDDEAFDEPDDTHSSADDDMSDDW